MTACPSSWTLFDIDQKLLRSGLTGKRMDNHSITSLA